MGGKKIQRREERAVGSVRKKKTTKDGQREMKGME